MLVIDDDPAWRALYRMTFEERFDIFEATDGREGLAALDAVDPDIIILDLRMPRMDGLDFIRRLRPRSVRGAIVVCSGVLDVRERPAIPGVRLATKTPDLRDLWSALCATTPELTGPAAGTRQTGPPLEDSFWRD